MIPEHSLLLAGAGLIAGVLAGFLGIGGGTVLVPILVAFGYQPVQAVATSALAIVLTATSGTIQNLRMGFIDVGEVLYLGLPALLTAQLGVYWADLFAPHVLLSAFGCLLIVNIFLFELRKRAIARQQYENTSTATHSPMNPTIARLATGGAAGLLAGLFGVGGGVIMVPLQILLLSTPIKTAIQTSLGVIVLTSISASIGHALNGNVVFIAGLLLGFGGLIGAQISTRFLPKLPSHIVTIAFRVLLLILAVYSFYQAWQSLNS